MLAATCVLAIPATGLALGTDGASGAATFASNDFQPFTPANIDPGFARQVAQDAGMRGLRFTPAETATPAKGREVTVAIRVDNATARAISVRRTIADTAASATSRASLAIAPTGYNLGVARGYQSFAKPAQKAAPSLGLRNVPMADLAEFVPETGTADKKPSRFKPRISLETDNGAMSAAAKSLDTTAGQTMDISGSYRVTRNLDVTAGVRYSQERDRIAPLTDEAQDAQAVYVGTQFRF